MMILMRSLFKIVAYPAAGRASVQNLTSRLRPRCYNLEYLVFGGKPGPIGTVLAGVWYETLQQFGSGSNPNLEPF
jgi:hypothetical protein